MTIMFNNINFEIQFIGATAVQQILNENKNFNFGDAMLKVQRRPWLVDNFDRFMEVLMQVHYLLITSSKEFFMIR